MIASITPDYAAPVAHDVADGVAERGVLVCGHGHRAWPCRRQGARVRAANIINSEFAALCREHNDANVITLSGRFVPLEENERILDTFFATDFGGGRHARPRSEDNGTRLEKTREAQRGLAKETIDGFGISRR